MIMDDASIMSKAGKVCSRYRFISTADADENRLHNQWPDMQQLSMHGSVAFTVRSGMSCRVTGAVSAYVQCEQR